ncbi:MAG: hypothetical protein LBP87_00580 [Planctomycetaceae bacterium]|jgi:hypothetical protein|nr:hypothetical protein [Planctomycetaceae bacterium]
MTKILLIFPFILLISLPVSLTGCGGSKKAVAKKDYGKPVWLKVDESKFAPLSEDATNLENGTVTVYDPEGWERLPRGSVKAPKGFKSVIVFKKSGATLMMTKSEGTKDLPDLDEENIEEFADGAQQKFKSSVKMVKLGDKVGVYFSRRVADAQRLSKYYDRRIVATTINGGLFTYELIADQGKINEPLQNTLFAVISKTQFENSSTDETNENETDKETVDKTIDKTDKSVADITPKSVTPQPTTSQPTAPELTATELVAAKPVVAETVTAETKSDSKSDNKPEPKPEDIAAVKPALEKTAEKSVEKSTEKSAEKSAEKSTEKTSSDLVVKSGSPEKKSETKKSETKKPAPKKSTKKGNTKDILNELDALLN